MSSGFNRRSAWLKDRRVLLVGSILVVMLLALTTNWNNPWLKWLGFGQDEVKITIPKIEATKDGQIKDIDITLTLPEKAFWDWLGLAGTALVPLLLFRLGVQFQEREKERAAEQAKLEKEIAADNLRDEALQAYFDRMSELLLDKDLGRSEPDDPARDVARTRTLTVLRRLRKDGERKASVLHFLNDADLLEVIYLKDADLSGADLSGANLSYARLSGANLSKVNLRWAILNKANLSGADLSGVNLIEADLSGANLSDADLNGANLCGIKLRSANLSNANLLNTDLNGANLCGTNLFSANLSWAKLIKTDLRSAKLRMTSLLRADLSTANLSGADLDKAILISANLHHANLCQANLNGTDLRDAENLVPEQIKAARNWEAALYSPEFLEKLGLPPETPEEAESNTSEI